ncbi:MAG: Wzz/FepE/Etk N-terminal domain-containing protein [Aestuariivirga sp.]
MTVMEQIRVSSSRLSAAELAALQREQMQSTGAIDGMGFIWRNLKLIIGIALACAVLALLVTRYLPKYYVAVSTVVLERKDSRPFESDAQLKSQDRDRSAAETEMDIIVSRLVMGRVADNLELIGNPSFNKYLRGGDEGSADVFGAVSENLLRVLSYLRVVTGGDAAKKVDEKQPIVGKDVQRDEVISRLISHAAVSREGESLAVHISVSDGNARMAAKLADTVASEYLVVSMEVKRQFANKAMQFLKERGSQPFLTALRNEEVKLQQSRSELTAQFGLNHPQIQAVDARIATVKQMIDSEISGIAEDLNNEAERPSARIVSSAEVPTEPAYPRTRVIVSAAFLGSALLSILALLVMEGMRTAIRSGDQVMRLLNLPNLAYVPMFRSVRQATKLNPLREIVKSPQSGFSEAMRMLYLGCRLPYSDKVRQAVMVTSCLPAEGKTAISIGLAATAAADGLRTALVDLDLHNYKIYGNMGLQPSEFTLEQFLVGECELDSIVQASPDLPLLKVIGLNQRPFGPSSLLNSERLAHLAKQLRANFDMIVFDTPPVLSVDDANWLAPMIDGVIMTVAWDKTTANELWEAASSLRLNQAPLFGTVINRVDPRAQSRFGLGGAAKYDKRSRAYTDA